MSPHTRIRYQSPLTDTTRLSPNERGHLLLLHVDSSDGGPTHAVVLAVPPKPPHTEPDPTTGRPLTDWPELRVARVWPNATQTCALRLARHPAAVARLCPICTPED
jgi:hypothetical protein